MSLIMCPFSPRNERDIFIKRKPVILGAVVMIGKYKEIQSHTPGEQSRFLWLQNTIGSGGMDMGITLKKPAFLWRYFHFVFYGDTIGWNMISARYDMPGTFRQFAGLKARAAAQRGNQDAAAIRTGGSRHSAVRHHDCQINRAGFPFNNKRAILPCKRG